MTCLDPALRRDDDGGCGAELGECADRFGPGLIAEDLPEMVPNVLGELYARKQELMNEERAERRRRN